jgi:hypothetical protein
MGSYPPAVYFNCSLDTLYTGLLPQPERHELAEQVDHTGAEYYGCLGGGGHEFRQVMGQANTDPLSRIQPWLSIPERARILPPQLSNPLKHGPPLFSSFHT